MRWRVLGLLVLASFVSYVLRYNVSIAGPAMMDDLGLSTVQLGWVLAAFAAGYALCQFPAGLLVDRFGARRVLAAALVLWSLLTAATGLVPDASQAGATTVIACLMLLRLLVGICHAPVYPLTGSVVERWFPPGGWALPNGLSSTGLTLGTAATATLLTTLVLLLGWRLAFACLAPAALLLAALWWWYMRDDPAEHDGVNAAELEMLSAGRVRHAQAGTAPAWRRVLASRNVLLLTLSYFCMNYVFYQFFNWVNYYLLTERGFGAVQAGYLTSIQWIVAALGATLGGLACDALSRRHGLDAGCRLPAVLGLVLCALFLTAGALAANAYLAVASLALCFFCNQFAEAAYWAAAIGAGGRHAGAACGAMNTGGNLVGFVNALLVPATASVLGWTAAMATGVAFALIGAALWFFVRADRPLAD